MPAEFPHDQAPDIMAQLLAEGRRQQAIRRQAALRQANMERVMSLLQNGGIESTAAFHIESETVTAEDIPELLNRRDQLNIAAHLMEAGRNQQAGNLQAVAAFRKQIAQDGGLLETTGYSDDDLFERICSPHWVISHSRGQIIEPSSGLLRPALWAADAQIELPADDATEPISFIPKLIEQPDVYFPQNRALAERIALEIRQDPASAAVLSDVGVAPYQPDPSGPNYAVSDYRRKKLASAATSHALQRIETDINPKRVHPIRYLISNMFSVPAIVQPDGQEVLFEAPIINEVSVMVHSLGSEYKRCLLAWESPQTMISVPGGGKIKANWLTAIRLLKTK